MWLCLPIPKNNPLWYFGQSRCYPADFRQIHVFPEQSDFLVSFSKLVEFKQREGSKVRKGGADTALGEDDTGRKCCSVFRIYFLSSLLSPPHFEEGTCHIWRGGKLVWNICVQLVIFVCNWIYLSVQLDIFVCNWIYIFVCRGPATGSQLRDKDRGQRSYKIWPHLVEEFKSELLIFFFDRWL